MEQTAVSDNHYIYSTWFVWLYSSRPEKRRQVAALQMEEAPKDGAPLCVTGDV
jgi:hypothetical protein